MSADQKPWQPEQTVHVGEASGARFELVELVHKPMPCGWVFAIRSRTPEASGPPLVSKEELVVLEKQFAGGFRKV